jgi:hypothetical protein
MKELGTLKNKNRQQAITNLKAVIVLSSNPTTEIVIPPMTTTSAPL